MIADRFTVPRLTLVPTVAFVLMGLAAGGCTPRESAAEVPNPTGSTRPTIDVAVASATTAAPTTTTLVTHIMTMRPSTKLVATPEDGRPGEPLSICGSLGKAGEIVRITLFGDNGDIWLDTIDSLVTTAADGTFCWEGEYPALLQVTLEGDDWGSIHPIAPGTYNLNAGYGSIDFATGQVRVLADSP